MTDDGWGVPANPRMAEADSIIKEVRDEADRFWIKEVSARLSARCHMDYQDALKFHFEVMNLQRERDDRAPLEWPP